MQSVGGVSDFRREYVAKLNGYSFPSHSDSSNVFLHNENK